VEVKLKATQKTVEKLFYVQPGADPSKIMVQVDGAKGLKLSKDGEIIIKTGLGELKLSKPIAWQEKDGKKLPVEVSYKLIGKNRYSFEVAKADPSLPIVIDPILQSTYLGGSDLDEARALAIHPTTGEVYVAGRTYSTNFPDTADGARESNSGDQDVFVARLNASLTATLQATYLGGTSAEPVFDNFVGLALHPGNGDVYVAFGTQSDDFPHTVGGAQPTHAGAWDAVIARLSSDLKLLKGATYFGGGDTDRANAIAVHPATGEVYIAGVTMSTDLPGPVGAQSECITGSWVTDAFVARFSADLTQRLRMTYVCGSGTDNIYGLAISPITGEVYVAGSTRSTNLPNTTGGAQASHGGGSWDAFVARLSADLTSIIQSTYLGGSGDDVAYAIAISSTGDVYVAGLTGSPNFPGTTGGYSGNSDAFVARLSANLANDSVFRSTYLGGSGDDVAYALAIHPTTGEVYVAGYTTSTDFPRTSGGAQQTPGGGGVSDAFVARLHPNLQTGGILQSTYLGGNGWDYANALAIGPAPDYDVYVAGETSSTSFPRTTSGAQASFGGSVDAFVSRLTADLAAGSYTLSINPTPTNGTVTSSPAGINCGSGGSSCSASFTSGSTVILTATPSTGYTFAGWTGDCSSCGTSTTCSINITADKTCSANFTASGGGGGGGGGSTSPIFGCSMTGSASSMAGLWNILVWLSVPAFVVARRIRRK
jgi:uncharacterized repeat protein (TIGR02543 family)